MPRPESRVKDVAQSSVEGLVQSNGCFHDDQRSMFAGDAPPEDKQKLFNQSGGVFRPASRIGDVSISRVEGLAQSDGCLSPAQRSMFLMEASQDAKQTHQGGEILPLSMKEAAVCIVSSFPDLETASRHFDINGNGYISCSEFVHGMRALGFEDAVSKSLFNDIDIAVGVGQRDQVVDRKEFRELWRLGGGNMEWRSPSMSPANMERQRVFAGVQSSVQSFGAFLEGTVKQHDIVTKHDLEDPTLFFHIWATGKWDVLRGLFKFDHKPKGSVRRKVSANEFVSFVRGHGFEGNAVRVFAEIQQMGPQQQELSQASMLATGLTTQDVVEAERDGITLPQLTMFQKRLQGVASGMDGAVEGSPVAQFVDFLRKKRGCILRAWRLDLDARGAGRVTRGEFVSSCKTMLGPTEARQLWTSLRPTGGPEPLEMSELDAEESANINKFAESLWSNFGFDLDRAWAIIEPCGRGNASIEEFVQGVKSLGFEGNAKILFNGLNASGLGRLWRNEFDYMHVFASKNKLAHSAPSIRALGSWVQSQFDDAEAFLTQLGFVAGPREHGNPGIKPVVKLTVSDLAARLTALGYPGDALHAATIAARTGSGTYVVREKLYALLVGKRMGAPPSRNSNAAWQEKYVDDRKFCEEAMPQRPKPAVVWRPPKAWKGGVDNLSKNNETKPPHVRSYFSKAEKPRGMSMLDATSPLASKSSPSRESSSSPLRVVSPKIDTGRDNLSARSISSSPTRQRQSPLIRGQGFSPAGRSARSRPSPQEWQKTGWDNSVDNSWKDNARFPKYNRSYFSDPIDRPVKEDMQQQLSIRKNLGLGMSSSSPMLGGPGSPPRPLSSPGGPGSPPRPLLRPGGSPLRS